MPVVVTGQAVVFIILLVRLFEAVFMLYQVDDDEEEKKLRNPGNIRI
mgnify:CR=1 FL=1